MTDAPYPRDLIGCGRNPPDPQWPGRVCVAVQSAHKVRAKNVLVVA